MTPASRIQRIRTMVAFALNAAESAGVDPTSCGAEVARNGGWSSLNVWFATADDMRRFVGAIASEDDGEHGEQGDGRQHLRTWNRDAYGVQPLIGGEDRVYVRLVAHDEQDGEAAQ